MWTQGRWHPFPRLRRASRQNLKRPGRRSPAVVGQAFMNCNMGDFGGQMMSNQDFQYNNDKPFFFGGSVSMKVIARCFIMELWLQVNIKGNPPWYCSPQWLHNLFVWFGPRAGLVGTKDILPLTFLKTHTGVRFILRKEMGLFGREGILCHSPGVGDWLHTDVDCPVPFLGPFLQ